MEHVYDFYKPDLSSEYPVVDGHLSIQCYLLSLDTCYKRYGAKASSKRFTLEEIDYLVFHSPFTKLVQKSVARLVLNDFLSDPEPDGHYPQLSAVKGRKLEETILDKSVERAAVEASQEVFSAKTKKSTLLGTEVGNMYTASVYGGLAGLLASSKSDDIVGQRVALFSYGSGLASSLYSFRVTSDLSRATRLIQSQAHIPAMLKQRLTVKPAEFEQIMKLREETHHLAPYTPVGDVKWLFPGTYYIENIDGKHRRKYARTATAAGLCQNGDFAA
jgi:hydroxymethylglutaryl-CoA synthase